MDKIPFYCIVYLVGLIGLYIAARVITRGILRSIRDWKKEKNNGNT